TDHIGITLLRGGRSIPRLVGFHHCLFLASASADRGHGRLRFSCGELGAAWARDICPAMATHLSFGQFICVTIAGRKARGGNACSPVTLVTDLFRALRHLSRGTYASRRLLLSYQCQGECNADVILVAGNHCERLVVALHGASSCEPIDPSTRLRPAPNPIKRSFGAAY